MTFGSEPTWTADRITELRRLTAEGLSASQIAPLMGVSRNAIIGKWYRNGITSTRAPGPAPTKPKRNSKPRADHWTGYDKRKSPDRKPPMIVAQPQDGEVVPLNVALIDLGSGQCRYPYGESTPFLFCGHPAKGDGPWCPSHHDLCLSYSRRERPDRMYSTRKAFVPNQVFLHDQVTAEDLPEQAA